MYVTISKANTNNSRYYYGHWAINISFLTLETPFIIQFDFVQKWKSRLLKSCLLFCYNYNLL